MSLSTTHKLLIWKSILGLGFSYIRQNQRFMKLFIHNVCAKYNLHEVDLKIMNLCGKFLN